MSEDDKPAHEKYGGEYPRGYEWFHPAFDSRYEHTKAKMIELWDEEIAALENKLRKQKWRTNKALEASIKYASNWPPPQPDVEPPKKVEPQPHWTFVWGVGTGTLITGLTNTLLHYFW